MTRLLVAVAIRRCPSAWYGAALEAFQRGADLHAADAPLQLTSDDKAGVRQALAGDIYTETRIRLPLLLRLDSMLAAGGAIYDHATISVELVLPQHGAGGRAVGGGLPRSRAARGLGPQAGQPASADPAEERAGE